MLLGPSLHQYIVDSVLRECPARKSLEAAASKEARQDQTRAGDLKVRAITLLLPEEYLATDIGSRDGLPMCPKTRDYLALPRFKPNPQKFPNPATAGF